MYTVQYGKFLAFLLSSEELQHYFGVTHAHQVQKEKYKVGLEQK